MRVLVTGGAGFIGSHLVPALCARGDEVVVVDSFDDAYDPALKRANVARWPAGVALHTTDVRDTAALRRALDGVEVVVHLAARAGVRASLRDPQLYTSVNIAGLSSLLDAMHPRVGLRLVFASSSSVYGASERAPFREDAPADRPLSPYAASKRAGELLCHAASAGWGLPVTCLRFFTVYGPRQRPDMAIHRFLSLALRGEPLPVFGDVGAARDYTWVGDVVAAVLAAVDRPLTYGVINVGTGAPVSLRGLVDAVGVAVEREVVTHDLPAQPGDVPLTHADNTLARALLGWHPTVTLDEGLRRTVAALRS